MKDVKIITPEDMGESLSLDPNTKKYEAISQIAFTEREATVDLLVNGIQLLFREVANSNRPMVVTGVLYEGKWYGDSPDNLPADNPFTGQPVTELQPLTNKSFATKDDLAEFATKAALENYVRKGRNGSWGDTIPVTADLFIPQRLVSYAPSTKNKPLNSNYGSAISFSNKGSLNKASQNWITTLAFGTDQRIFYTQSINAGQDDWLAIPTSTVSLHTIKLTGTMPAVDAELTIPVTGMGNRDRVASIRMRFDLANTSLCMDCPVEIISDNAKRITGLKFTNAASYDIPQGRPFAMFVTIER